jgi:hypothetical protein
MPIPGEMQRAQLTGTVAGAGQHSQPMPLGFGPGDGADVSRNSFLD